MKNITLFAWMLYLSGCGPAVEIKGFDNIVWKKDINGCSGLREGQIENLFENRVKLKGLREDEIKRYLGMPDQKDLLTRSQKMYKYWIAGSPVCPETGNQKRLVIRFNAINKANEVFIE